MASNSIRIQLNVAVIFVMAQNLNAVVHKVILWQLDTLLRPAKEQTNSHQWHWAVYNMHITSTILFYE